MGEQEIEVRTPDGEMTAFVAHPDGEGPFPVAVLYMDGIGYREQVKEKARRFAVRAAFRPYAGPVAPQPLRPMSARPLRSTVDEQAEPPADRGDGGRP